MSLPRGARYAERVDKECVIRLYKAGVPAKVIGRVTGPVSHRTVYRALNEWGVTFRGNPTGSIIDRVEALSAAMARI